MDLADARGAARGARPSAEAFDLPGLGRDRTPVGKIAARCLRHAPLRGARRRRDPAIVVGSSMGGIVATQGAARCPERVAGLVYAAAFIPKDGQSLLDLTKLPEGAGDQVQANVAVSGEPPVAVMSVAASRDALYACCADDVAEAAIAQQTAATSDSVRDAGQDPAGSARSRR